MIAKFFKKTKPINTLLIVALLSVIFIISKFYLHQNLINVEKLLSQLVFFGLLLITVFVINFIIRKNGLTKGNSYALLLLVFCIGMFPYSISSTKLLIVHFILLLAYRRLYSLRTSKDTKEKLFDSAIYIGIAALIYPLSIFYIIVVYAALFLFNKLTLRNFFVPIIGLFTPGFIYLTYLILIGQFADYTWKIDYSYSFLSYNSFKLLVPLAVITGLLIWSVFSTTVKIISINNEFRTSWFLLLYHLLISILVIIPSPIKNGSEFLFLFFPVIIIFTNYIQMVKEKWFKEVFLYFLLLIMIIVYFL